MVTMNLVLYLDTSGSMSGERLEAASQSSIDLIESLNDSDRADVSLFSDSFRRISNGFDELNQNNKYSIVTRLQQASAGGNTCVFDAIVEGSEKIMKHPKQGNAFWLVVLTDGEDTSSSKTVEDAERALKGLKDLGEDVMKVIFIGLSLSTNQVTTLKRLASAAGDSGKYVNAPDVEAMKEALQSVTLHISLQSATLLISKHAKANVRDSSIADTVVPPRLWVAQDINADTIVIVQKPGHRLHGQIGQVLNVPRPRLRGGDTKYKIAVTGGMVKLERRHLTLPNSRTNFNNIEVTLEDGSRGRLCRFNEATETFTVETSSGRQDVKDYELSFGEVDVL